ncbi:hypothetical protein ACFTAO_12090 [Paenibacillus rhizoplanae]
MAIDQSASQCGHPFFKIKEIAGAEPSEPVFIELHFEQGYLELMLSPFIYSVIQLVLWVSMWIMILSKE